MRSLTPPGTGQLLIAQPGGTLGFSQPLSSTAGLGLYAQVVVNLTLYGSSTGFASYSTNTPGIIDIYTTNSSYQATERGFSFTMYRP